MSQTQLAAQLYTLRNYTKTPGDIASTFKRVKALGYDAVQCSALGPIDAKELKKILDDNGLACCATHVALDRLRDHTEEVVEDHKLWNCSFAAIGGFFPRVEDSTRAIWSKFIHDYNLIAAKFRNSGVSLGYHNHSHEFARLGDPANEQTTAWQLLKAELSSDIWMELDTYWIQHAGSDPSFWIDRFAGRIPCLHLKDFGIKLDRSPLMMEVGQGNLNWPRILESAKRAGVKWYIVEQDECYRDPFESLKISLDFLKSMGLK
ncbi:MAG TPA: sugar phosphate isomerase/epimerase [Tepidisphaeraceae bacterium]|nr:sugar phosphate isomerase/epimerase [Tepidisphaeraceae bacterium]